MSPLSTVERLLWVENACSQSLEADLLDAGALQRDANVGCTSETGRQTAEGAEFQMTASEHKLQAHGPATADRNRCKPVIVDCQQWGVGRSSMAIYTAMNAKSRDIRGVAKYLQKQGSMSYSR